MSTPIEVRRARPEEYAAVAELTATVYLTEGWGDEGYEPVLRDVAGRAARALVLVALDGLELLGTGTVATRGGPYAEQAVEGDAVVRMLVTVPAARGRGVGELLVRACLDASVADGCRRVRLSTQPGMAAAHRLYERLGFTRTPEHDWSPVPNLLLITYVLDLPGWCGQCGARTQVPHPACGAAGEHEPPRWCVACGRRCVVQVLPTGWTSRCVEHGSTGSTGVRPPARGGAARR